jgi:hypothetical protein
MNLASINWPTVVAAVVVIAILHMIFHKMF